VLGEPVCWLAALLQLSVYEALESLVAIVHSLIDVFFLILGHGLKLCSGAMRQANC